MPLHNSSAEIIGSNEHLITEILIRLPVKPLLRFKSVSKQWLSLLSTPHFCHRHTRLNPNNKNKISGILLRTKPTDFQFLSLNPNSSSNLPFNSLHFLHHHHPAGIKIVQCCNGLFLCCTCRKLDYNNRVYYVFNPTTNQFSTIPPITGYVYGVSLAFQPCNSPYYKLVCIKSSTVSIYNYEIVIYSSENRSWKLIGSPFVAPFDIVFDNGVFHNGVIHWISPTGASLVFDVNDECFTTMPNLPVLESWGKRRFRYFGESCGHLQFFEIYGSRSTKFTIFEMEKDDYYTYKWFVKYQVDLDAVVTAFPEMVKSYLDSCDSNYYAFIVLSLVCEENEEDSSSLLLHIPGKVMSYNVKDKTFKKIYDLKPSHTGTKASLQFGCFDAYQYIETLACV